MNDETEDLDPDLYPPLDTPPASSNPIVLEPAIGDDQVLDLVQRYRHALVKDITKQGMPQDNGDRNLMLATLRDMSHDVLTKKKIGSEERASQEASRAIVAAILTAATPNTGRVEAKDMGAVVPALDTSRLEPLELIPDETRQGEIHDNYEEFQARMNQRRQDQ